MTILGAGWPMPTPRVDEDTQRRIDVDDLRYEQLLATVGALRTALLHMPTPVVNVSEPDLSAVVNAVNGLRPGATADEIGEAIVSRLGGGEGPQIEPVLARLTTALETLDFRMKGLGSGNSISGPLLPPALSSAPVSDTGQAALPVRIISQLGAGSGGSVTVSNFPATQPVSIASTVPVSGTFWQTTQPVSLATNTPDVTDRAARLLGHVTVDSAPVTAVTGTFWQATQPVSGSGTFTTKEVRTATGACMNYAVTTSSGTALNANANRIGATFYNEGPATVYLALAPGASVTAYTVQLVAGAFFEVPFNYTGIVTAVTSVGTATLRVTEMT